MLNQATMDMLTADEDDRYGSGVCQPVERSHVQ